MAKENKSKLIIWAAVALVIGVILGLLITNITTTGNAKSALGLDSGRQEANLQEARQDLVLNLLRVNRIENSINNRLEIESTGSIETESESTYINANSDIKIKARNGGIKIYNENGELNFGDGYLNNPGISLKTNNLQNIEISTPDFIITNPAIPEDQFGHNSFTVQTNYDNNQTGTRTIIYGDLLIYGNSILSSTKFSLLDAGADTNYTGNAYACLTADGTLFRSTTPCN